MKHPISNKEKSSHLASVFVSLPCFQTVTTLLATVLFFLVSATPVIFAAEPKIPLVKKTEDVPIRGIVRARAKANISTDIVAKVTKVPFKEGQIFRTGDLLVQFDCRHRQAELRSAQARKREIKVSLKSAVFLMRRRAGSRNDVDVAKARLARASADADAIGFRLKSCAIYAPYAGRIARLDIQEHEISSTTKSLLVIVALRNPRIELVVPSNWLNWLVPGKRFSFSVDETGRSYLGKVIRLGATVIAVNQTIKVFAVFTNPTNEILPGMSGTAKFSSTGN